MESSNIHHPKHYTIYGFEVIDLIDKLSENSKKMDNKNYFYLGNALKYILRCNYKYNRYEDLKKCYYYADRLIAKNKNIIIENFFSIQRLEKIKKLYNNFLEPIEDKIIRNATEYLIFFYHYPSIRAKEDILRSLNIE